MALDPAHLKVLFDSGEFPAPTGLYFEPKDRPDLRLFSGVSIDVLRRDSEVRAMDLVLYRLVMALLIAAPPTLTRRDGIRNPGQIWFFHDDPQFRIDAQWPVHRRRDAIVVNATVGKRVGSFC